MLASLGFRGSEETENPSIFGGFPCLFPKEARRRRSGMAAPIANSYGCYSQRSEHSYFFRESPDVGLAPTALWRVPPPKEAENPSLQHSPSFPTLAPSSPHPRGSFCNAPGRGACAGVRWNTEVEGESPPSSAWGQTHIWGHSYFYRDDNCSVLLPR